MTLTPALLKSISPQTPDKIIDLYFPFIAKAMIEFDITTAVRQSAFIAQIAHESGDFRYMREIWGPTQAQERYEGRKDLGNTRIGDGQRYKGRGAIQITGRANYKHYGDVLNVDLENNPELAEKPELAFRTAGAFWKEHGLNELADKQQFEKITRRINGGLNGLAKRQEYYARALDCLK